MADGALLGGRYRLVRELGRGASGRVLLAEDTASADAQRAIKLVDPAEAGRLCWELELLRGFDHPNLLRVYELLDVPRALPELDVPAGALALVTELAPGEPASALARTLARDEQALLALCAQVASGVARALAALHARSLVHGDVKPDNVLVQRPSDGAASCKLIDFGLAAKAGVHAELAGSPGFMAPEAFRGERGPSVDFYALGASLRALLQPSVAGSPSLPLGEHLARALAPRTQRTPLPAFVPPALAQLIDDLTEADPAQRLSGSGELLRRAALLREALGLPAEGADHAATLGAPSAAERALSIGCLPFVGHAAALEELTRALERGELCTVSGPDGAGRSRLVREAVARLQAERAARALRVPSYRRSERLPSAALGADCVVHLPHAAEIDAREAERCLRAAALEGHTLALVLERPTPTERGTQIRIGPLPEGELRRLCEHALPDTRVSQPWVREALAVSSGLAGRLCELLAELLRRELDPSRPQSLRALGSSVASATPPIPELARELVERLVVAGGELTPAAARIGLDARRVAEGSAALCALGLAAQRGATLVLRRDLVAPLRAALPAGRCRELAALLPERELPQRARAFVWLGRGEPLRALAELTACTQALCAAGDPEQAAEHAREGLSALAGAVPDAPLRLELAGALRALGRYAEALAVLEPIAGSERADALAAGAELERLAGRSERARERAQSVLSDRAASGAAQAAAEVVIARLAFDAGEIDAAEQHAEAVLARGPSPAVGVRALELKALCALHHGDAERAATLAKQGLEHARPAKLAGAEARLLSVWAECARLRGDARSAIERFAAAVERADAGGEQHAGAAFLHNVGVQQLDAGELGPATAALREAARRLSRLGRDADLGRALYNLGHAAQLVGADELATSAAERAHEAASAASDGATRVYAETLCAEQRLRAGDRKGALALLAADERFDGLASEVVAVTAARRAALCLALGEREAAQRLLARADQEVARGAGAGAELEAELARTQLELEQGHIEAARLCAARAHGLAEREGTFDGRLRAALLCARAERAGGQSALHGARLSEARALLDQLARSLPAVERTRLRAVEAYRPALEAAPAAAPTGERDHARTRALAGVAKRLLREQRQAQLHPLILELALELVGAEAGYLVLRDREGRSHVRERRGPTAQLGEDAVSRSIVARVIGTGTPLTTVDAAHDERLSGAASVHALALRSVLAVPLRLSGEVLGAIYLEDRLRPFAFGQDELALLGELADFAAIALDGVRRLRAERQAARRMAVLRARLAKQLDRSTAELSEYKRSRIERAPGAHGIVAHGPRMLQVLELVERLARSDVPVLICGESGTGKELVARAIHDSGPRAREAFVSENCGAIPEPLLESALFGHVRGAFTGADRRRLGLFEVADGGTLFLDEIGEMSLSMQSRLLRVLQDGEVRPLGSDRARKVDVRVLAATHRDLPAMIAGGRFREDLYYRLAVVRIELPPLRDRPEDIEPLLGHLLRKHSAGRQVQVDRHALARLCQFAWPGNVRQLENELRRALVLADDRIGVEHLSAVLTADAPAAGAEPLDLRAHIDALERRLIRQALDSARGNQTHAARMLGVSRFGLQKMMRRLA